MAKPISTKDILKILFGMGLGGLGGITSSTKILGGLGGLAGTGATSGGSEDSKYPTEFAPGAYHVHKVTFMPSEDGSPNMNQLGKANSLVIDEAGEMQDIQEHNNALTKYVKLLPANATPRQLRDAIAMGREEEKKLPKFWNESNDRREFSVSSSAVDGIRITPEGSVEVKWHTSPTWYTFKNYANTYEASKAAKELLKADSIGRAVWPVISRPPKKPNPLLGGWNSKNYEGGYA